MPDEPIFDGNDRLPPDATAAQIKEHYERREATLIAEANRRIAAAAVPEARPRPAEPVAEPLTDADFLNRPLDSTRRVIDERLNDTVRREEFNNVLVNSRDALISAARYAVERRHADFREFEAEIVNQMKTVPVDMHVKESYWETAYLIAKGLAADRLVEAARVRPADRPSPASAPAALARELSEDEKRVGSHLGVDPESHLKYIARYEETGGLMPFTYDTRKGRR